MLRKIKAIFQMKCPRCFEGNLFSAGILEFKGLDKMPANCPYCNQKFKPEPGYWYGAMFISYILSGWFCLIFVGICILVFKLNVWWSFILLLLVVIPLYGWLFRISRSLWIHFNIKYDPSKARTNGQPKKD